MLTVPAVSLIALGYDPLRHRPSDRIVVRYATAAL